MSFLTSTWDKILSKLGQFGAFIPMIAEAVKLDLKTADVDKFAAHLVQLEQFANSLLAFVAKGRQAIADGKLSLKEGSELALEIEAIVDEAGDVYNGHD